jgi:peptidyl-prolyl cis-trans isomerase SurA
MNMKLLLFFVTLAFTTISCGQEQNEVLMTIDGKPYYASEFTRVYKKNLDLVKDESQKSVDSYLELFVDYKLKVAEAYDTKLHENSSFKADFEKYEEQLSRKYIYEDKVTEEIVKEAYDRGLYEIEASHILLLINYTAAPQDTLAAYNKIKKIREEALSGNDFKALVEKYSEEPGAAERGGYLGYFSAFAMVYPFESAAYNTNVGEISEIVRTQFGYHIIKVTDKRARLPEIKVSHIMVAMKGDSTGLKSEKKINEINLLLNQGESFESLARQFSTDKGSAEKGGELKPFRKGMLRAPQFEEVAYSLTKKGQLSEPFKSSFGWHIIKFDSLMPERSFEDQKSELEEKVKSGDRSKVIVSTVIQKIKDQFGFSRGSDYLPTFLAYLGDSIQNRRNTFKAFPVSEEKALFTIGDRTVNFSEFDTYIKQNKLRYKVLKTNAETLTNLYNEFEEKAVKRYFNDNLEKTNRDYAAVISEYRDGLLIFDVMDRNVWSMAKNDSVGLKNYYSTHIQEYLWKPRVDASIISATTMEIAQQVKEMLESNTAIEEIKATLAKENIVVVTTEGLIEVDSSDLPENFIAAEGVSDIYTDEDSFVVVNVNTILESSVKTLDAVRGRVINSYQAELEKRWMQSLRTKYSVEMNDKTLKKLKKQLK